MQVLEVLALPFQKESIKKIDKYLSITPQTSIEYYQALSYKALILNSLDKTNDALKILIPKLDLILKKQAIEEFEKNTIVCIADTLKVIFMGLKRYDLALKYIEIKEKHLNLMAHDAYFKDMILYSKAIQDKENLKRYIKLYLADDISEENLIFAHEILINILFDENNYEDFLKSYQILNTEYLKTKSKDNLLKINILKIKMLINQGNIDDAIDLIKDNIDDVFDKSLKLELGTMLIKLYYEKGDFHRASIQDANYLDLIDDANNQTKREYYTVVRELYEKMNNHYARDLANKALEELALKETVLKQEPLKKERVKRIQEPIVIERIIEKKDEVKNNETKFLEGISETVLLSKKYLSLKEVLDLLKCFTPLTLREVLRQVFVLSYQILDFSEVVILINQNDIYGYHYKKERLYDKKFIEEKIINTVNYLSYQKDRVLVISDPSNYTSIITNQNEIVSEIVSFPLKRDKVYGSITFYGNNLSSDFNYELLEILASFIDIRLSILAFEDSYKHDDENRKIILDTALLGFIENDNGLIKLDDKSMKILDVEKKYLNLNEYLDLMTPADKINYKNTNTLFITGKLTKTQIEYSLLNGKRIKEIRLLKELSDRYVILGMLENKTDEYNENLKLKKLSEEDFFTKLPSLNHLKTYLLELDNSKRYSFVMIGTNNFKLYKDVYGLKFSTDLIYAIALKLKEVVKEDVLVYHFDSDRFILLLPNNDERTVKKQVLQILDELALKLVELNKRLKLSFSAGVFLIRKKYGKLTYEKLVEKSSLALDEALRRSLNENKVIYFEEQEVKNSFYDFQMELHISEAIDNLKLCLTYEQIVNLKTNKLFAYLARINLGGFLVDDAYFYSIVKKRGLEELIDKYLINRALIECKKFYHEFGGYFKIFIQLHAKTLAMPDFMAYLSEKYRQYNVPRSIFSIEIIDEDNYNIKTVLEIFNKEKILVGSSNLEFVLNNHLAIYFASNSSMKILKATKALAQNLDIEFILNQQNFSFEELRENNFSFIKGIGEKMLIEDIIKSIK